VTRTGARRQYLDVSESDGPPGSRLVAFDALYDREYDYVWRTLGRLGVGSSDLPDAVHDVFVVVFRRWEDFDPGRPVRPWLFGVARKVAAGRRRKAREVAGDVVDARATPDDRFAERDLLWRALSELTDERLEVVVLHDLEGHTGADIAARLAIPVNTVHSRLRLARADLVAAIARLTRKP
jgi:RNA polymerase sigma-70 factor (ECF subfamily)